MIAISVIVNEQAGYKSALNGLSFNKKMNPEQMHLAALKLGPQDGGHNKFLESIMVWLDVRAPRYLWQEMDTYRISTKQSESTMHTLVNELARLDESVVNRQLYVDTNFENGCHIDVLDSMINHAICGSSEALIAIKGMLPEGFLQRRMWCMSFKTLRNLINQRRNHRLPHWQLFIRSVVKQLDHPEYLGVKDVETI